MEQKNGKFQNICAHENMYAHKVYDLVEFGGITIASSNLNQANIL